MCAIERKSYFSRKTHTHTHAYIHLYTLTMTDLECVNEKLPIDYVDVALWHDTAMKKNWPICWTDTDAIKWSIYSKYIIDCKSEGLMEKEPMEKSLMWPNMFELQQSELFIYKITPPRIKYCVCGYDCPKMQQQLEDDQYNNIYKIEVVPKFKFIIELRDLRSIMFLNRKNHFCYFCDAPLFVFVMDAALN